MKLDQVDINMLGRAKKSTITKDETILLGGAGDKHALEERVEQLRQAIAQATSDYDRWVLGSLWMQDQKAFVDAMVSLRRWA